MVPSVQTALKAKKRAADYQKQVIGDEAVNLEDAARIPDAAALKGQAQAEARAQAKEMAERGELDDKSGIKVSLSIIDAKIMGNRRRL